MSNYYSGGQIFPPCKPNILYRNDNFLSNTEIQHLQSLLKNNNWNVGCGHTDTLDTAYYISQDLYRHYKWDGDWQSARWLDTTPPDWEDLYRRISELLPPHYVHWIDVKLTGPYQGGTPIHRDKDPGKPGGGADKFIRAITVLCNLNTEWDPAWGGGFVLYETDSQGKNKIDQTIPIVPGQLLIVENCVHSIELITEPARNRVSFILHVLEYSQHDSL